MASKQIHYVYQGRSQDLKGGVSKGQICGGWTVDMQSTTLSRGVWRHAPPEKW